MAKTVLGSGDISQTAFSAINTTRDFAELVITFVSFGVGLFALIGIGAIWFGVRWYTQRVAERVANERFDEMVRDRWFQNMMQYEVEQHFYSNVVPSHSDNSPMHEEEERFPMNPHPQRRW